MFQHRIGIKRVPKRRGELSRQRAQTCSTAPRFQHRQCPMRALRASATATCRTTCCRSTPMSVRCRSFGVGNRQR